MRMRYPNKKHIRFKTRVREENLGVFVLDQRKSAVQSARPKSLDHRRNLQPVDEVDDDEFEDPKKERWNTHRRRIALESHYGVQGESGRRSWR